MNRGLPPREAAEASSARRWGVPLLETWGRAGSLEDEFQRVAAGGYRFSGAWTSPGQGAPSIFFQESERLSSVKVTVSTVQNDGGEM